MRHTILFVDDEEYILNSLSRLLPNERYKVMTVISPKDALQVVKAQQISVVISDQRMPDMSGIELLREVKAVSPDTVRVIMSGYTDFNMLISAINEVGIYRFVAKPWDEHEFRFSIESSIRYYELLMDNKILLNMVHAQKRTLDGLEVKYPGLTNMPTSKSGMYEIKGVPQESLEDFIKKYFPEENKR